MSSEGPKRLRVELVTPAFFNKPETPALRRCTMPSFQAMMLSFLQPLSGVMVSATL